MKDDIRHKLRDLMERFPDLLENERRLKAALKDYFPRNRRIQNLLHMTAESGLLQNAMTLGRVDKFSMHGYVKCLTDDYGIGGKAAKEAIALWLQVLEVPFEDIAIEEQARKKAAPVIREPEPKAEPPDPMAQEREENRKLESMVQEYNALLHAKKEELEEQSTSYCYQYQVERFHVTDARFWADAIKKQAGTPDWWTVCWRRSRYWTLPFGAGKYALFPNPKLIHDGHLHTVPRLYEFFTMITLSDDYDRCVKAEPAILTVRQDRWKKFSGGILYIG